MNHCDRKTAPTAAAPAPTPTLLTIPATILCNAMTYNGAVLPTSSPFLPRAPTYRAALCPRIKHVGILAAEQRPSYTPRLQLKDFLSYALGSVAAVLQEGAGEAGALPVDDQLAPRHLNSLEKSKAGKS